MKIAHLTSVHPRADMRIFHKMCASLVANGFATTLIVADGHGDEQRDRVSIWDVGASKGRLDRIRNAPGRIFGKALALNSDLYHLHDPELIPTGLKLKRLGKRVVFDSHEDVPSQLLSKPYLNKPALCAISKAFALFESWACRRLDGIVAATPAIRDKFVCINPNTVDINNFPLADELATEAPWTSKQLEVCYVGGIGSIRGIREVCAAMGLVRAGVRLNLCGRFSEPEVERTVKSMPGWGRVNEYGYVDRDGVRDVLSRSMAGLVTLHPAINFVDALPVKMFEYMAAGIPVIASDFPLWREIIEASDCGLLVDPLDPSGIAQAIDYVMTHPDEAQRMGANGSKAVLHRYNWQVEERKLLAFYDRLLTSPTARKAFSKEQKFTAR